MRIAIMAAAFGLALGVPGLAPTAMMSVAVAQDATLPAAEQASVDAAIDAVLADATLTADQVTQQVAAIVQNSSNPVAAARRVRAKAEATGDTTQVEALGGALQQVVTNLQDTDPNAAADIQVEVALSASADFQIGYVNGPTTPSQPQTGGTTGGGTTPDVVTGDDVPPPPRPTMPVIPTTPEPNPVQVNDPLAITALGNNQGQGLTVGDTGTPVPPGVPIVPEPNPANPGSPV